MPTSIRWGGQWLPLGGSVPAPDPGNPGPGEPTPEGWTEAWASNDQGVIDGWFEASTGYEGLGLALSDLSPVNSTTTHDGQVIKNFRVGNIKVRHNNVTIEGGLIGPKTSALYGIQADPGVTGLRVSYVTLEGDGADNVPGNASRAIFLQHCEAVVSHCKVVGGFRSGFRRNNGTLSQTWEYNYVKRIARYGDDPHNTAFTIRSDTNQVIRGCTVRRCNFKDGTSAAMSIYPRGTETSDILVEESIFNVRRDHVYYCLQPAAGGSVPPTNTRIINNKFGEDMNPWCGGRSDGGGTNSGFPASSGGNQWSGNVTLSGLNVPPGGLLSTDF